MPLTAGTRLGPYEIVGPLGTGGMGEVYRARDLRLGRTVALKVLPSHIADQESSRVRFEREARAISALQHPNICTLHDIGTQDGIEFLVMECLEGETLEKKIQRGALPLDQVLRIGAEIAYALDRAHKQGVLHRDLKPSNIVLTKTGAKLLDFGLAKGLRIGDSGNEQTLHAVETLAQTPLTGEGHVVGTFQYMSPEQIEGREVDSRSDIFSLGAVLYECITGKAAFAGRSAASIIAAILTQQPPPITEVRPLTPRALDHVVRRALGKDPDERWQSAADIKAELEWVAESTQEEPALTLSSSSKRRRRLAIGSVAVILIGLAAMLFLARSRPPAPQTLYAHIVPPPQTSFLSIGNEGAPVAVSPDGTQLVYGAGDSLWWQSLTDGSVRKLAGTHAARWPFWSPDNRSIGFFSDNQLRTLDLSGGDPIPVADAPNPRGGSWGKDGTIIFAPDTRTGIFRVPASGGQARQITQVDASQHSTHRWPLFLPDGKHFIYLAANHANPRGPSAGIYISSISNPAPRLLTRSSSAAQYASGMLLFLRENNLMAQRVDLKDYALKDEPVRVAEDVFNDAAVWRGVFSVSQNGLLTFQRGGPASPTFQLTWYDRTGRELSKVGPKSDAFGPRLSHDDKRLAIGLGDPNSDLWIYELIRGTTTRLTFEGSMNSECVWSPDDRLITYAVINSVNQPSLWVKSTQGIGDAHRILEMAGITSPTDWSPDGRFVTFTRNENNKSYIWIADVTGKEKPYRLSQGNSDAYMTRFSPNGRWISYTATDTGREEVYVSQFPGGTRVQVSIGGGKWANWTRGGKELIFAAPDNTLMSAEIDSTGSEFLVKSVRPLFQTNPAPGLRASMSPFAVTADGTRILVNKLEGTEMTPLTLVTTWTSKVRQ